MITRYAIDLPTSHISDVSAGGPRPMHQAGTGRVVVVVVALSSNRCWGKMGTIVDVSLDLVLESLRNIKKIGSSIEDGDLVFETLLKQSVSSPVVPGWIVDPCWDSVCDRSVLCLILFSNADERVDSSATGTSVDDPIPTPGLIPAQNQYTLKA